jgi:sirohydrochlorin cobaltochelatase
MKGSLRGALVAVAFAAIPAICAGQQPTVGTLIIAHGGGPAWDAQVHDVAANVDTGGPIEVSFLMGPGASEHRFQDAAQRLVDAGAGAIVVVPLLVSSHSGHYDQIRWLAGEIEEIDEMMLHHLHGAGIDRAAVSVPIHVAPALDDSPQVADVLASRALDLAEQPATQALFLMGHGPNSAEDNAEWMANLRPVAARVEELTGFRDVKLGLVRDDAPAPVREEAVLAIRETILLQHELTNQPVVVVPILISTGQVSQEKFPADLEGLPVVYGGDALLPHPGMAAVVEARVSEAAKALGDI